MKVKVSKQIPFFSVAGDFIILNFLFVFGFYIRTEVTLDFPTYSYLLFFLYLNVVWLILLIAFDATKSDRNITKKATLFLYTRITVFFFFLFLLYFQAESLQYYPRSDVKFLFIIFYLSIITWKLSVFFFFELLRKKGLYYRNVVIAGLNEQTAELSRYFISNPWHGYRFLGFFDDVKDEKQRVIGSWDDINSFFQLHKVDEIYLALHRIPKYKLDLLVRALRQFPLKIRILPELEYFSFKSAELVAYGTIPVLLIHPGPLNYWYNRLVKRLFDLSFSLIIITLLLSWISIILYFISLAGKKHGLFFIQKRTGIDGRVFNCIKFRSMVINQEADIKQAEVNDTRITAIGRILRKTSLDELPQFINVLLGDMSVIGPRPHMLLHTDEYRKRIDSFMIRHTVKPGITGLAQINGYRGEIKGVDDLKNRVEADVAYVENWSFNLDFRILLQTLKVIFRGQKEAY